MEMRKKALKASIDLIKEYSTIDRLGKLFYLWHAAHCLVESGICLLASVLSGMECPDRSSSHLRGEDITVLVKYIKTFPVLLWKISRRWPSMAYNASALETVSVSVLEKLQDWATDTLPSNSDLMPLKEKLNQYSRFSPFPSSKELTNNSDLDTMLEGTAVPINSQFPTEVSSFDLGWADSAFNRKWHGHES